MKKLIIVIFILSCFTVISSWRRDRVQQILGGSGADADDAERYTAWIENINDPAVTWCSGVLIGQSVVTVANYCVNGVPSSHFVVHLGDHTRGNADSCQTSSKVAEIVTEALVPVALLILETPPSTCVKPIKMMTKRPNDGVKVNIYGWGITSNPWDSSSMSATTLQGSPMIAKEWTACENAFPGVTVDDRFFCVRKQGAGFCYGDGGGPVVRKNKLAGFHFHNPDDCAGSKFTLAVSIPEVLDWILKYAGCDMTSVGKKYVVDDNHPVEGDDTSKDKEKVPRKCNLMCYKCVKSDTSVCPGKSAANNKNCRSAAVQKKALKCGPRKLVCRNKKLLNSNHQCSCCDYKLTYWCYE